MMNNRRMREDMREQYPSPINCIPQELVIEDVILARAYVPFQHMCDLFNPMESLLKGTAFPELFSPYDRRDKKYRPNKIENS